MNSNYTQVKFMSLSQLKRIRESGYVGEHNKRTGKQRDYHDQRKDIDARIWELEDRTMNERIKLEQHMTGTPGTPEAHDINLNAFFDVKAFEREDLNEIVMRSFKPWKWLGYSLIKKELIDASPY